MVRRCVGTIFLFASALGAAAPPVGQDVLLEAEIEPAQVYVQAQALYQLRLYQAVDVSGMEMHGPAARLAEVRPIGTGRVYEAQRGGRRYRVHERSYAIFPFSSGALELEGAHALGRVITVGTNSADGRQSLRLDAPARTLTVRPVPAAAAGIPWLPARALSITESWTPLAAGARPGQALRRNIRIEAHGTEAGQIPPLHIAAPGMMVDAEAPQLENRMAGNVNIGVREQTFRMVAQRAGEIVVPELRLRWWNLDLDAMARATLPARTLHVEAVDSALAAVSVPIAAIVKPPAVAAAMPIPAAPKSPPVPLAVALLLICALAMVYFVRRPGVCAGRRLQRACRAGTAVAVRDGLLDWAASIWPNQAPPLTLEALAGRLSDPVARTALGMIERSLYGPGPIDAAALAAAVRTVRRGHRQWRRQYIDKI